MMKRLVLYLSSFSLIAFFAFSSFDSAEAYGPSCFPLAGIQQYVCSVVPVDPQFVKPDPIQDEFVMTMKYVRLADLANVYAGPSRSEAIVRNVGDGFLFSTVYGQVKGDDGQWWYIINPGEYMHPDDIKETAQSSFRGVEVTRQPERPFGWIVVRDFTPSSEPDGEPDERFAKMYRYDFFEVFDAIEGKDGFLWYNIGDGRWIKQVNVSLVDVDPRPEGVGPNEYWTEIDLYEQTLAAYEGDRLVFATLISSGLNQWPTYEGLFQIPPQERHVTTKCPARKGKSTTTLLKMSPTRCTST